MPKPLKLCNLLKSLWGGYSDDVGKALIHLGATGWFFSALAQIGMIATNENIDKKSKKFLIPQEITDGAINVTLYYTISQGIKHFGEFVLDKGKIITNSSADIVKKINPNAEKHFSAIVKNLADVFRATKLVEPSKTGNLMTVFDGALAYLKGENISAIEKLNKLHPEIAQNIKNNFLSVDKEQGIQILKNARKEFCKFKNGTGVIMAVTGSILSCNMITPVCRNISANYFQKKLTSNKKNIAQVNKSEFVYKTQLPMTFNVFKI